MMCECDSLKCTRSLPITDAVYLASHVMHPKAAVVLPGHQSADDVVLKKCYNFLVVHGK